MAYLNKKQSYFLIVLCFLVYSSGYIGRLNYNASLIEILGAFGAEKTEGGLVSSFFFFAYGVGQLVNGILSKRYNPRVMLSVSLVTSSVINLAMPLAGGLATMKWLWMLNGFSQSILWSTVIKTLSHYISDTMLSKAILIISTTVAVGTFLAYGLSALCIAAGHWRLVFFIAAGFMLTVAAIWFFGFGYIRRQAEQLYKQSDVPHGVSFDTSLDVPSDVPHGVPHGVSFDTSLDVPSDVPHGVSDAPSNVTPDVLPVVPSDVPNMPSDAEIRKPGGNNASIAGGKKLPRITPYMALFFLAIVIFAVANGFVKDGTVTWTPLILYEEFGVDKVFSVILTFALPLLSVFGAFMAAGLHKRVKSFPMLIGIFFVVAMACLILLTFVSLPAGVLLPAFALFIAISCCMAAVNNILTSMIPLYFRSKVNSGTAAGVINTFCYVGSTLSSVIMGLLADTRGWTVVFIVMAAVCAVALVFSLISAAANKKVI